MSTIAQPYPRSVRPRPRFHNPRTFFAAALVVAGAVFWSCARYNRGVEHGRAEHLLEYQDYILAYRLRALLGDAARSPHGPLSLRDYASKRLERQALARGVLKSPDYRGQLRRVEALTDALNFGFWHNPGETVEFLRRVIERGGCRALESPAAFASELLTRRERAQLSEAHLELIASYYLGLLRASASYLDGETFTRLRAEIEPLRERLPFFVLPTKTFPAEMETR